MKIGDILRVRYFKNGTYAYTYLDKINDKEYFTETIVSKEFIDINNHIFINVTKAMKRDNKLETILN